MADTMTFARGARRRVGRGSSDVRQLDTLAHWLDSRFSVFGIRFGLDSILGIVPGIGDLAGLIMSSAILVQGYRLGARKRTLARMAANVAGDTLVGSIPVVGTLVDVVWKANRSNMRILRRDLDRQAARR